MEYHTAFAALLLIASVHIVALVSPGPDFFLILRNSISQSRIIGLFSAFGLGLGVVWHTLYSLFGISYLFHYYPHSIDIIAVVGSCYLCFLGINGLRHISLKNKTVSFKSTRKNYTPWQAVQSGFFTNVLNPKAYAYFISVFSSVSSQFPQTWFAVTASSTVILLTMAWFSIVALLSTTKRMQELLSAYQGYIDLFASIIFICFGLSMLLFFLAH